MGWMVCAGGGNSSLHGVYGRVACLGLQTLGTPRVLELGGVVSTIYCVENDEDPQGLRC